jgi:hypothetical protein
MYRLQYLVPPGFRQFPAELDRETTELARKLKDVDKRFVPVPNSALSIKMIRMLDGTTIEVRKRQELAFVYCCCIGVRYFDNVFALVSKLYKDLKLGSPAKPTQSSWIHCIPIPGPQLRDNEVLLSQKLTVNFFWALFYQELKRHNPLN